MRSTRQFRSAACSSPAAESITSARVTNGRQSGQTSSKGPIQVIDLEDNESNDDIQTSGAEVVPLRQRNRADKGKGRQRDESPPVGSIFISKLPDKIKQGCKAIISSTTATAKLVYQIIEV